MEHACVLIKNHLTFPLWLQPLLAGAEGRDRELGNEWKTPGLSSWGEKQKETQYEHNFKHSPKTLSALSQLKQLHMNVDLFKLLNEI